MSRDLATLLSMYVVSILMAGAVSSVILGRDRQQKYNFPASRRGRSQIATSGNWEAPSNYVSDHSESKDHNTGVQEAEDKQMDLLSRIFGTRNLRSSVESQKPRRRAPNKRLLKEFGAQMASSVISSGTRNALPLPQLSSGGNFRQFSDDEEEQELNSVAETKGDGVRCIPKVMQVEELVYDEGVRCHHSYNRRCHTTYITDYVSTTEEKCDTTFKKSCHIIFVPVPFNETVSVCHTPVERKCSSESVGPDVCSVQYETTCETKYKSYTIEQDEPVCEMEVMRKCKNVTFALPEGNEDALPAGFTRSSRAGRQLAQFEDGSTNTAPEDGVIALDENCEEWPVKKCHLERRTVTKVQPDTACRKIPRQVCVPNNCKMTEGKEICRNENRMRTQNVPEEDCELQPEKNCRLESVLVPKLIPQNNCIKVPKEVCIRTKKNPRIVKKPVVKEWCYKPSDIKAAVPLMRQ